MPRRRFAPVYVRQRTNRGALSDGVDYYYDVWLWSDGNDDQNIAAYVDVWEWGDSHGGGIQHSYVDVWEWGDSHTGSYQTTDSYVDVWQWSDSHAGSISHTDVDVWEWGDALHEVWTETYLDVWEWGDSHAGSYATTDSYADSWTWSDEAVAAYGTFDGRCYSMNEFGAVSEYSGWEFDSFASVSGAHYAVTPAGLYTIGGDTQAGTDIDCGVRSGLTNFGAGALVGLDDLIVMADSDDETVAKIREMKNGHLNEHWYRSNVNVHGGPREYRIKSGRGLRGALLSIEVGNKNGADWEMDQVQVYPVVLDRRRVS